MNGKQARMLRNMRRRYKSNKRLFNSLTHIQKGQLRKKYLENDKLVHIDFLKEYE